MKVQDLEKKLPHFEAAQRIDLLKTAVEEFDLTGDQESYAHALLLLGNAYHQSGQLDEAMSSLTHSMEIFGKLGDPYGEAAALNNLGFANKLRGNISSALDSYEKALSIYRSLDDKEHEGIILLNISNLYYSAGEYLEAIEYLEDLVEVKEGNADSAILLTLGKAYTKANDHRRALEHLEKAFSIAKESGDKKSIVSILKEITGTYLIMGDTEKAGAIVSENASLLKDPVISQSFNTINETTGQTSPDVNTKVSLNVSKDVRTYLTSVIGYAQHIKESYPEISAEELADMMNDIEVSALTINELISNLDAVNAIYEGRIEPRSEPVNLGEIVLSVLNSCSARIKSKNINVIYKAGEADTSIASDKEILMHIINNLISNAVTFTPPGKNIYAYIARDPEKIRCEIIDEGSGLTDSEAANLFGGTSQGGNKYHPEKEDSAGIGLTVASNLAKLIGGELRFENMLGKGSAYVLELKHNRSI